ncbi:MAG TPA: CoA-binding protein [Terriglobales bacterium]|nr:CoA-binding protein [Terriglobales bacterium]
MNSLADIRDFLAQKRIALVGVSRNPRETSHVLFKEFVSRGYDMVAVNPNATQINGSSSFARLEDVTPAPDAALLMTSDAVMEDLLHDWKSGVRRVWIYGTNGKSKVSPLALSQLRSIGVIVVDGECPFMFLAKSGGIHTFHGFVRKVLRSYPA